MHYRKKRHRRAYYIRKNFRTAAFFLVIGLLILGAVLVKQVSRRDSSEEDQSRSNSEITPTVTPTATPEYTKPTEKDLYGGSLVLVNNSVFWDFPELDFVNLSEGLSGNYSLSNDSHKLRKQASDALDSMLAACVAETNNTDLVIISSYRTRKLQQTLWDRSMERNGQEQTEKYIAVPGGSEHHTGLAVDLGVRTASGKNEYFEGELAEPWIYTHMAEYGFILRYREEKTDITGFSAESWHLRYVGLPHAALIEQNGFCLEEYLQFLRQYTSEEPLTGIWGGRHYAIWYTKADSAMLPVGGEYDISGDNMGGCIVTSWE